MYLIKFSDNDFSVEFNRSINIISGVNNSGKTRLLRVITESLNSNKLSNKSYSVINPRNQFQFALEEKNWVKIFTKLYIPDYKKYLKKRDDLLRDREYEESVEYIKNIYKK